MATLFPFYNLSDSLGYVQERALRRLYMSEYLLKGIQMYTTTIGFNRVNTVNL